MSERKFEQIGVIRSAQGESCWPWKDVVVRIVDSGTNVRKEV